MFDNKRGLAMIAWSYLALGALLSIVYLLGGESIRSMISGGVLVVLVPAALIAARSHGFPPSVIAAFAAVAGLYVLSSSMSALASGTALVVWETAIDTLANACIFAIAAVIVARRRGRFTAGDILDGVIISLGAWLVAWIVLVQPYINSGSVSTGELVLNALYLPASVPLIAVATVFLFTGHARRAANWFVSLSLFSNVLGDMLYALQETRDFSAWTLSAADVLYIFAYTAAGAAFIHPTARDLLEPSPRRRSGPQLPARVIITSMALVAPVMVLALTAAEPGVDRVVRAGSVLALLLLVGLRMYQATKATLESQDHIIHMARTDELTGLPNKAALLEIAADTIDSVWRTASQPSLFLFDLDRFKNINDSLGHQAGDQVIHTVADRLRLAASTIGATVARPSGDEFLVLDPTPTSAGQALAHAEVLHSVFNQPMSIDHGVVFVTASVGVATMEVGRPLAPDELFRHADIAMYRAKDAGRNCLALYDASMQDRVSHRMKIETELHGALDRREFRLFHQPIVDTDTGRVVGFEALIRWQRADGDLLSPAEFIPIAEETGIITSIGSWALLEALTQLNAWLHDRVVPEHTTVSVNVSPRQLQDPHFVNVVEEALQRSAMPAHLLWLEVTESMMIENPEVARKTLQRIRALGVRIALDDFGTGYSSLSLLQQFPLQRIKIDRSFVHRVIESSNDRSLIRTIIGLGDSMGLDVVAEGVETVAQLKMLRELGCAKAQGFLISHPVPPEAMRSTIAALESLAEWPDFAQILGGAPLTPRH